MPRVRWKQTLLGVGIAAAAVLAFAAANAWDVYRAFQAEVPKEDAVYEGISICPMFDGLPSLDVTDPQDQKALVQSLSAVAYGGVTARPSVLSAEDRVYSVTLYGEDLTTFSLGQAERAGAPPRTTRFLYHDPYCAALQGGEAQYRLVDEMYQRLAQASEQNS